MAKKKPSSKKQTPKKTLPKKSFLKKFIPKWGINTWLLVAMFFIVVFQFLNNARLNYTISTIAQSNAQIIDEVGSMSTFINTFGIDLNEVREFLLLPTHNYGDDLLDEEEAEEEEEDPIVDLFQYLEELGEGAEVAAKYSTNQTHLEAYLNAQETLTYFAGYGLNLQSGLEHDLVNDMGITLITVELEDDGTLYSWDYQGEMIVEGEDDFETFKTEFESFLVNDLETLKTYVEEINNLRQEVARQFTEDQEITAALAEKEISVSEEQETDTSYYHEILTKDNLILTSVTIDKETAEIWVGEEEVLLEEFSAAILAELEDYDGRTELEKQVEELRVSIEALQDDEGFESVLNKYNMSFSFEEVEDETSIQYFLLDSAGEVSKVIYISKETGELMIKEPEAEIGSLLSAMLNTEKKTIELPESITVHDGVLESDEDINILVAGKNGWNVDTMIFANVNTSTQKVKLVSIPRDLYYNGRKINSVYADYGMEELTRQISDISGYRVDQYILVDMYVFSDLIDLVDGVDVTLTEDLVDPTYKVYENGLASTLYYPAGEHHLDGTEALRIARSRHTTSDYSRAARQQLILEGLQTKASTLGFGDADTVIQLIQTSLDQTETNISFDDAFTYYLRYRNFEVESGNVISSGNVLDSVKLPVNFETSAQVEVCEEVDGENVCEMQYAVYTLMPRDGNWDYIKWYFQNIMES